MSEILKSRATRLFALVALLIGFAGAAVAASHEVVEEYLLGPGDVVDVVVLEDAALNRQALVRPDGKINLPLAGSITAAGRSPEAVAATIRARLANSFVEPPSVTVALVSRAPEDADEEDEDKPRQVYVLGEVASPGLIQYDPERRINVLQALSMAGGPGPFAARTRIQVREADEAGESVRTFDYTSVETGGASDLAELADGAVIIVPERGFMEFD